MHTKPWLNQYPPDIPHEIDLSGQTSLANLIESTCSKFPNKDALICMGSRVSFEEYEKLSSHLASYFQNELGLTKGDRIAIMLPNIIQFPVAFFAAQKLGLICVNINPQYTHRELKHQLVDSEAKAIVILDMLADKLEKIIGETKIEHVIETGIWEQLPLLKGLFVRTLLKARKMIPKHRIATTNYIESIKLGMKASYVAPQFQYSDVAILQYTGGTSGTPKGAMLTQGSLLANINQVLVWAKAINVTADEVVLTALPLYHIFALTVNFLTFLTLGGTAVLVPRPIPIINTVKIFKKYRITLMTGVNTLFNSLNHSNEFKELAPKTIKIALAGGMALQESVNSEWQNITGNTILEGFGMTETSPVTHCNPTHIKGPIGSIGLPLPSTDAKIVGDDGVELEIGGVGELTIRGPQLMKGYYKNEEETKKVFVDGWLRTGDIAKMDEQGFFYIVDRKKDMIVVSGFNVYPNEVEEVIASHSGVKEVAVVGVADDKSGEKVVAYVVKSDPSLSEEELNDYCRTELTGYKRPRSIYFENELPKSNIGKILRRKLKERHPLSHRQENAQSITE